MTSNNMLRHVHVCVCGRAGRAGREGVCLRAATQQQQELTSSHFLSHTTQAKSDSKNPHPQPRDLQRRTVPVVCFLWLCLHLTNTRPPHSQPPWRGTQRKRGAAGLHAHLHLGDHLVMLKSGRRTSHHMPTSSGRIGMNSKR